MDATAPLSSRHTWYPDMATEKEKMLAGALYDPADRVLVSERQRARRLCQLFNSLEPGALDRQQHLLDELLGAHVAAAVTAPFFCDYGYNIELASNVYFNFNCVLLDVARISVGKNTLFGPGVHIYAAMHPMGVGERRAGLEFARPVMIGEDVWVGGAVVICPGVTIGSGSVIGAGSIVTRDIPPGVFAAGNPCRVVRSL